MQSCVQNIAKIKFEIEIVHESRPIVSPYIYSNLFIACKRKPNFTSEEVEVILSFLEYHQKVVQSQSLIVLVLGIIVLVGECGHG